jgi:hypothetical protein
MLKLIEKIIFKIPVVSEKIACLQSNINRIYISYRNEEKDYLNLQKKYKELGSKYEKLNDYINNNLFIYIDSEKIWAMPEWSVIDGPMSGSIIKGEKDKDDVLFFVANDEYYFPSFLSKNAPLKYTYNKIQLRKGDIIKYYWKYNAVLTPTN